MHTHTRKMHTHTYGAQVEKAGGNVVLRGKSDTSIAIHPASLLKASSAVHEGTLITYHEKVQTTRNYIRDATVVHANAALLFGGTLAVDHVGGHVTVDAWLKLKVAARTAVILRESAVLFGVRVFFCGCRFVALAESRREIILRKPAVLYGPRVYAFYAFYALGFSV